MNDKKEDFSVSEENGKIKVYLELPTWKGGVIVHSNDTENLKHFLNVAAQRIKEYVIEVCLGECI